MLHPGDGELVCCGAPTKVFQENTVDAAKEKHIPVIETITGGFKVKVGTVAHPMEEKHSIEWIEVMTDDGRVYRQFLKPGTTPEATFNIDASKITAREYCNVHGLWKG
jgi:superoxide reductase